MVVLRTSPARPRCWVVGKALASRGIGPALGVRRVAHNDAVSPFGVSALDPLPAQPAARAAPRTPGAPAPRGARERGARAPRRGPPPRLRCGRRSCRARHRPGPVGRPRRPDEAVEAAALLVVFGHGDHHAGGLDYPVANGALQLVGDGAAVERLPYLLDVEGRWSFMTSWALGLLAEARRVLADDAAEATALQAQASGESIGNRRLATSPA
jgi:hypothetical protein